MFRDCQQPVHMHLPFCDFCNSYTVYWKVDTFQVLLLMLIVWQKMTWSKSLLTSSMEYSWPISVMTSTWIQTLPTPSPEIFQRQTARSGSRWPAQTQVATWWCRWLTIWSSTLTLSLCMKELLSKYNQRFKWWTKRYFCKMCFLKFKLHICNAFIIDLPYLTC